MKAKKPKSAPKEHMGSSSNLGAVRFQLLELPVAVLHQVLGMLDPEDLQKLLQTSKDLAQQVMQHSAGRLTFRMVLHKGVNLAAVRKLLQWAPPACLKLTINTMEYRGRLDDLNILLYPAESAIPAPNSPETQHVQQLPCILEICLQWFDLASLVPSVLATVFPNLHTLHLYHCVLRGIEGVSSSNSSSSKSSRHEARSGSNSTGTDGATRGKHAAHIHTLMLEEVDLPECLSSRPPDNARLTRSMQVSVQHTEQLKSSMHSITRLHLRSSSQGKDVAKLLGAQLTELLVLEKYHTRKAGFAWWAPASYLQQLQKLVLPDTEISDADVKQLLSLHGLTHLEVGWVSEGLTEDYSSCACKWKSLQFHLHRPVKVSQLPLSEPNLCFDSLAKLPLHSLAQPLRLGSQQGRCVLLQLPTPRREGAYARLERLAQQLKKCGVQVLGTGSQDTQVAWCGRLVDLCHRHASSIGDQLAAAITMLGPVLGPLMRVSLLKITVGPATMEALATVYSTSLTHLVLKECTFVGNLSPAWHAALSGLPALHSVKLENSLLGDDDVAGSAQSDIQVVRCLAAAMAQQPAGRCIEVARHSNSAWTSSEDFAERVMDGAEGLLTDVEITPKGGYKVCLHITSQHRS